MEDESIDVGFAKFNTIVTSLKALDKSFSSKNYVRKFLRALHPKWRAKVTAIKESKDLSPLSLVHEMIMEKDSELVGGKREKIKSPSLKAKDSSDDNSSLTRSEDEKYAMVVRDFKKFFRRRGRFVRQPRDEKKTFQKYQDDKKEHKCFGCGDPIHLIRECPKPPRHKDQKAFVRRSWSDKEEENEEKTNDETCLMAQPFNEVHSNSFYYSDENSSIDDDTLQNEYNKIGELA
ncbi:zf-CCHC domain-containing protein [Tanacetum coccineum]|uniref:Zf-CCHC domain-containing protein n=1 Tax=Tanacetum coccineum TaxID=301880 RepID=A0ABQ5DFZ4_9ASTR